MKRIKVILNHIKEDALDIQSFIKGMDINSFKDNILVRKAICMSIINIGELVKTLPDDFRIDNPSIPWRSIAGLRDITASEEPFLIVAPIV